MTLGSDQERTAFKDRFIGALLEVATHEGGSGPRVRSLIPSWR